MTKEQALNYLISSGFTEEQIKEIVNALDQRMPEIVITEMYKEIVKAVHNQYITVITRLEDILHEGYASGLIVSNDDIVNDLIIMHTTIHTVCCALKDSCDAAIEVIESEEE